MTGDDALLLLADRLANLDAALEQAGFSSCLVDRDWMRSHSDAEEWRDFLVYRREHAREVVLASQPAKIEHSNPDEYRWHSAEIAGRVRRRFQEFGDVHALFLNSSRRHLTQLTAAAQRLHRTLERATDADVRECNERFEEFNRRYARELQQARNADALVQGVYEDRRGTWMAVEQLFVRMVTGRVLGQMRPAGPTSLRLVPDTGPGREWIEFAMEFDPEKFAPGCRGTMFLKASYRSPSALTRRLHIVPLLPEQFSGYLRFASRAEFVLCFTAWLQVATHATRALLEAQWRLQE